MSLRSLRIVRPLMLATVLVCCMFSGSAAAQLAGVKVTISNLEDGAGTIDADITATVFYGGTVAFATAWMGYSSFGGLYVPAVDWGDGAMIPPYYPTGIPFDTTSTPPGAAGPVRAYRASFSHTYEAASAPFTIAVYSSELIFSPDYAFTGDTVTLQTGTYSVFGGLITLLRNTAEIPGVIAIEIPAVSEAGLLLLAAACAVSGVFLLRR